MSNKINFDQLAFSKYLFEQGIYQAQQSFPHSSLSILSFQDSVELFLRTIIGYYNLKIDDRTDNFYTLLNEIKTKTNKEISSEYEIKILNKCRVALKHNGIFPAQNDIQRFQFNLPNFFEENSRIFFNLDFDDISLIEFIKYPSIKTPLKSLEQRIKDNDFDGISIDFSTIFISLLEEYEKTKINEFGISEFKLGSDIHSLLDSVDLIDLNKYCDLKNSFERIDSNLEYIYDSINEMNFLIKAKVFNFDLRKFIRFSNIVSNLKYYKGYRINKNIKKTLSKKEAEFCLNFIIECSIKLGDFEYETLNTNTSIVNQHTLSEWD